jgi:hypothetical protein
MRIEMLNLAQSFEKLNLIGDSRQSLTSTIDLYHSFLDANKIIQAGQEDRYAEAFGVISTGIKKFLVTTTDLTLEDIDKRLAIIHR